MKNKFTIPRVNHYQLRIPLTAPLTAPLLPHRRMIAQVVDMQDRLLCDAIIKYATEQGYTDLYVIDEKFVRTAIEREIERMKSNA